MIVNDRSPCRFTMQIHYGNPVTLSSDFFSLFSRRTLGFPKAGYFVLATVESPSKIYVMTSLLGNSQAQAPPSDDFLLLFACQR